ncbi:hypothetical protein [Pandoravirus japonicus]|uniref:Uncharacterized protein n=1 Tax=Pandoravirus japonicus TaxID=2823154 RepID=A0A811BNK5_9VIRU|nr:hypothetical protein [Pandoravirus japonicus]
MTFFFSPSSTISSSLFFPSAFVIDFRVFFCHRATDARKRERKRNKKKNWSTCAATEKETKGERRTKG